jgi:hypothetical protein
MVLRNVAILPQHRRLRLESSQPCKPEISRQCLDFILRVYQKNECLKTATDCLAMFIELFTEHNGQERLHSCREKDILGIIVLQRKPNLNRDKQ